MAFTYSVEARFARAKADFLEGLERGSYSTLRDRHLRYYIEKYDLPASPEILDFINSIDTTTKTDRFLPQSAEILGKNLESTRDLYFLDMEPFIHEILLNIFLYSPEFDKDRKYILYNIDRQNGRAIVCEYFRNNVAPALLLEEPTKYAIQNKYGHLLSADLIYGSKQYYRETNGRYVDNFYRDLHLIHELDKFKSKINPYHRDILTYTPPSSQNEVDFDERESSSADRCF